MEEITKKGRKREVCFKEVCFVLNGFGKCPLVQEKGTTCAKRRFPAPPIRWLFLELEELIFVILFLGTLKAKSVGY